MQNQQQEMDLTPEELEARKEEMLQFYTESLPYLEAQFKYEDMLMKLDEVRFKRANIQIQHAMMIQQMNDAAKGGDFDIEEDQDETTYPNPPSEKERKLKKS
jgi:hypothetical protein